MGLVRAAGVYELSIGGDSVMLIPAVEPSIVSTREIIVSISALVAAVVAFLGINAWRRQLKGTTEYQGALKVLQALYALREAVIEARSRFTFPSDDSRPAGHGFRGA
jgi:hypothetical protein